MRIQKKTENVFDASKMHVGIVRARFNEEITDALLKNAQTALAEYGVKEKNITVIAVPGSVEIPFALQVLAKTKKYDCLIALGSVIRGETPHFDYVCKMAQEGVLRVSLDFHIPIGFGLITANTPAQATARIDFGRDAALAALKLANIKI